MNISNQYNNKTINSHYNITDSTTYKLKKGYTEYSSFIDILLKKVNTGTHIIYMNYSGIFRKLKVI